MLEAKLVPCISCGHLISNQIEKCPKCESSQILKTYKCMVCKSNTKEPLKNFHVCSMNRERLENDEKILVDNREKATVGKILVCNSCFDLLTNKQKEHYLFLNQKTVSIQCSLCKIMKVFPESIVFHAPSNQDISYSKPINETFLNSAIFSYIEEPTYNSNHYKENQKLLRDENCRSCENCGNSIAAHVIERFAQEFHYKKIPYISVHSVGGGRRTRIEYHNNHMCWVCGMGFSISKSKPVLSSVYLGKDKFNCDINTRAFFHQDCLEIIEPFWRKKVEEDRIQKKLKKDKLEEETIKMEQILNRRKSSEATAKTIKNTIPWIVSIVFAILAWIDWGFAGVIPVFIISYLLGLWIGHILYEKHSGAASDAFFKQKIDGKFIGSLGLEENKRKLEYMRSEIEEIDSEKLPYIGVLNIRLD